MSDTELIRRIKATLKQQGVTQRELAEMLGKKETEISRWMSGRIGISDKNLQRIEEVLHTSFIDDVVKLPIRIGIVGTGSIADRFASEASYVENAVISAAYNPNETKLKVFCDKFGIRIEADSYEHLLSECDAVYIASPIATHYSYAKSALESNKHVLCEMPFTQTKAEAEELYRLAEKKGLKLVPALKTAFCPSFLKLIEIAKSGEIGEIADISATVTTLLPENSDPEFSIERLLENATCPLLAAIKLFGTHPTKVNSYLRKNGNAPVFTHAILEYAGAIASLKIGTGVKSEGSLVISGTKGYIYVPAPWWKTDYFEIRRENPIDNKKFYFPYEQSGLRYETQAFVESIIKLDNQKYLTQQENIKIIEIQNRLFN